MPPPSLQTGQIIARRFQLHEVIGRGGYGQVWSATRIDDGVAVAIKFLRLSKGPDAVRRFELEARILATLTHPNCVGLIESGRTEIDSHAFIVMELLDGITLNRWMDTPRSLDEILDVGAQIAAALSAAHRLNLIHRDIKFANIMVCDDQGRPRIKVLDFGLAKMLGREDVDITKTGEVHGTPGFMSPEQLRGSKDINATSDLYNLGAILFEMIEGKPPFWGASALEIAMKHLVDPVPAIERDIPPRLRTLVTSLLSKDPRDRPPTALVVGREIAAIQAGEPVVVRVAVAAPERTRSPWMVIGGTAVLVVGLAVLALFWPSSDKPVRRPGHPVRVISSPTPPDPSAPRSDEPVETTEPETDESDEARSEGLSAGCGENQNHASGRQKLRAVGLAEPITGYIPRPYLPTHPHPIVVVLHARSQGPEEALNEVDLQDLADEKQFIIVAPAGYVVRRVVRERLDAAGVLPEPWIGNRWRKQLADIEDLDRSYCVDRERIFVIGLGAGANVADRLPCEFPSIRASVSSSNRMEIGEQEPCRAKKPLPYLFLAPTRDLSDPVEGGTRCPQDTRGGVLSLADQEELLRRRHGCDDARDVWHKYGSSICYTWDCEVPLVSCQIDGGRHWPGKPKGTECAGVPGDFPYGEAIWAFFDSLEPDTQLATPP